MVMKLIRTDTSDNLKILLPIGDHLIGRGKFLGCDDKRISRNHSNLEVRDDHIIIKALHHNPCFYSKSGSDEKQILKKDMLVNLCNGDRFGLLPDEFWYEVLNCALTDTQTIEEEISDKDTEDYLLEQNPKPDGVNDTVISFKLDETIDSNKRAQSPSLIPSTNNTHSDSISSSPAESHTNCTNTTSKVNSVELSLSKTTNENNDETKKIKRTHSTEQLDYIKKIKTEPQDVKKDDDKPVPSLDQPQGSGNGNNKDPFGAAKLSNPLRERCMYGGNCYRKNPSHRAQFSHPRDDDWGVGAQIPCPYGAACTRRDPRHYRDHTHPPGHRAPPQPGVRGAVARRKRKVHEGDETESDDGGDSTDDEADAGKIKQRRGSTPQSQLIVTGKRQRKVLQKDNWSGSDGEQDPYGTDESDEWRPLPGDSQDFSEDI